MNSETPMSCIASVTPPPAQTDPAWWFVFRQDKLLVALHEDTASIPMFITPDQAGLVLVRTHYLGLLDDRHCYAAEVSSEAAAPDGMAFYRLRGLFEALPESVFWVAGRAFQLLHWEQTHQYCGQCGQRTHPAPDERARTCPNCGLTVYPRISPAIIVAVTKEDRILLAHAPRFPKGLYSVVAGFVEVGETFEECVRREVLEETGIAVRDIRYFGSQPWPFPHSLMVAFTAQYAGGSIRVDGVEITDAGWFRADELPQVPSRISVARRLIDWFSAEYGTL
jgi:NAD+ diphosphatase